MKKQEPVSVHNLLKACYTAFIACGVFSFFVNLLMLTMPLRPPVARWLVPRAVRAVWRSRPPRAPRPPLAGPRRTLTSPFRSGRGCGCGCERAARGRSPTPLYINLPHWLF